jgi:DNA-binding transcriptional ArsR family regulator
MDTLQVIAEPKRRKILALVWDTQLSATQIADQFDVTFGAISQHLGVLREAGFVTVERDGNRRLYQADKGALGPFRKILEAMWVDTLQRLADVIEANEDSDNS